MDMLTFSTCEFVLHFDLHVNYVNSKTYEEENEEILSFMDEAGDHGVISSPAENSAGLPNSWSTMNADLEFWCIVIKSCVWIRYVRGMGGLISCTRCGS